MNDFDAAAANVAEDCVVEAPGASMAGPQQFLGWMRAFADALPDITHEVSYSVEGDSVHADVTVRGTHTAPLVSPEGAISATGRPIEIVATNEMQIAGNKIASLSIAFDQAGFMKQLGMG